MLPVHSSQAVKSALGRSGRRTGKASSLGSEKERGLPSFRKESPGFLVRGNKHGALTPNPEEHVRAWPPGTWTIGWPGPEAVLADGSDLIRQASETMGL